MTSRKPSSRPSPARRVAFDILRRVETESAYASVLLASLPPDALSREDLALAHEIVLGVLRWQGTLDFFIQRYSNRSIARMDSSVVIALRMGIYQLRYLERVPAAAAVNESVALVRRARIASAAGFANAVLRKVASKPNEPAGVGIDDSLLRLAAEVSHPVWLLARWASQFGDHEAELLASANNTPPRTAFRINTRATSTENILTRLEAEGIEVRSSIIAPGAFVVERGRIGRRSTLVSDGSIYLQDEASQAVSFLLDPKPGDRILDLCAAPGSKTSHLALLASDRAWIAACDLRPARLATVIATCRRMGITSVSPVAANADGLLPFDNNTRFDLILVDAPCSGTGTLRQNPEIKWRLSESDIERLSVLQLRLLRQSSALLRTGGRLVYSTCSLERDENEAVVTEFLKHETAFLLNPTIVPATFRTAEGFLRTFPHRHGTDGFFAAVIERSRD